MRFGDMTFSNNLVGQFQGTLNVNTSVSSHLKKAGDYMRKLLQPNYSASQSASPLASPKASRLQAFYAKEPSEGPDLVDSRDAKLQYLYNNVMRNGDEAANDELIDELNKRKHIDAVFRTVFPDDIGSLGLIVEPEDFGCLRLMYDQFEANCGQFEDYSLKYVKYLVNACETTTYQEQAHTIDRLVRACSPEATM